MPVLVLLNGAPGVGKSTLARRYADDHPLSVVLDIDLLRSMVGGWRRYPLEAGILARRLAIAGAGAAISDGRIVLVPQLLARVEFVEELARTADTLGVPFMETVIVANLDTALARYQDRAAVDLSGVQVANAAEDPREVIPGYMAAIDIVVAHRPGTVQISNNDGEDGYGGFVAVLARALAP